MNPARFGRYEVLSEVGEGSMGRVYKAFDPLAQRTVAIKVPRPEWLTPETQDEYLGRFRREAQAASRLTHPDVVTVFDVGDNYFVMEFLDGATLQAVLRDRVRLDVQETVRTLRPVAEALDSAHTAGIVHRDVKPGNIMMVPPGRPKLMDFGVAHVSAANITAAGQFLGSPSYMAPEQIVRSEATPATDCFSLAVVAYEMLTGQRPFAGDSISAITYRVVNEPHLPPTCWNPSLLPGHDAVFARALAKDPNDRFPSAAAFVNALSLEDLEDPLTALLASSMSDGAGSRARGEETQDPRQEGGRRPWTWSTAAAAVLALSSLALVKGSASPPPPAWMLTAVPGTIAPAPVGLEIETNPAGATITIDGASQGRAPLRLALLPPGEHTVRVSRPGFADAEMSFELVPGSPPVPLRFKLQPLDGAVPVVRHPVTPGTSARPRPSAPGLVPPRRITGNIAAYPDAARRLRLEGTVDLEMLIDSKGEPAQVRVVRSAGDLLDEAVLGAARTWRFEPARRDGTPVSARYLYRHHFSRGDTPDPRR